MHGLNIVETFAIFGVALMSMLLAVWYIRALFARAGNSKTHTNP
jgi:hypothetical protein